MRQKADTKTTDDAHADCQSQMEALSRSHCILELDPEGVILSANTNFLNLLGYTLKEIKGEHHRVFMDAAYADSEEYQTIWRSIQQEGYPVAECKWLNKKGSEVWLQASYNPVRDRSGHIVKVMQLARDITANKIERQMYEAEYTVLTDIINMTSIVSHSDLRGNITDINEKYIQVSKYNREELIGSPHSITRHPDMPKSTFKQVWNTIGHGKIFRGVIKNRAKDGTPYYVDAVIAPVLGSNGKPKKYIGVRYDIGNCQASCRPHNYIPAAILSTVAPVFCSFLLC